MAAERTVSVALSITTLDAQLARTLEPRTSSPAARLRAVRQLADAGIPVRVMVAPIIPGLNDFEMPAVLEAASQAGAQGAGYTLLRLPWAVRPVFVDWLQRNEPLKAEKVQSLIRATRGGKLNEGRFGSRMRGQGPLAEQIKQTFQVFARRYGLDAPKAPLEAGRFRPPRQTTGQLRLF
jgi:DNA repair photolyase